MRVPYLQSFKPSTQLTGFVVIFLFNILVWSGVGSMIVQLIWGLDVMSDPNALSDFSNPAVQNASQTLMFCQHLGFIVAAMMFTYFVTTEKHRYLLVHQRPKLGYIFGALAIMVIGWPIVNWLVELNASVQLPEFMSGMEQSMQDMEQSAAEKFKVMQKGSSLGNLFLNLLLIAVLPAVGEELVFRGIIQKLLARWTKNIHWAVWISGAIFSFFHFQFYGFLPRMLLGVLFGYLLVWSGTIWVPIIVHFFNNAVTLILHWLIEQGTISANVDDFGATGNSITLILAVILLIVALFFYRRKSRWQSIEYEYMKN